MKVISLGSSSAGNAYIVECGNDRILLDAGLPIDTLKRHIGKLNTLSGALITHEHMDHAKAVGGLLKNGVYVYMSKGTKEVLLQKHHRIKECQENKVIYTNDKKWQVLPLKAYHDAAEPFGYVVNHIESGKTLYYMTDTNQFETVVNGCSIYMIECNYSKKILAENMISGRIDPRLALRISKSHADIDSVVDYLKRVDMSSVEEIHLLHLSNQNSDEIYFKLAVQRATGAVVIVEKER